MATAPISLKGRALRLLSGREYSHAELLRKLSPYEEKPGDLAKVLDELAEKGFVSDQRALESLVHRRAAKLGGGRIRQELQAKGLAPEAIHEALAQLRASETDRALQVWRKKFGGQPADASERARQMRFLASRGFDGDVIRKVIGGAIDD